MLSLAVGREESDDGAQLPAADELEAHVLLAVAEEEAAALPESGSGFEVLHESHVCENEVREEVGLKLDS